MSSPVTRTTKTKGRFVLEVDMTNSRFFAFLLAIYLHRVDRARRKIFGSITLAQVAELIGLSSVEPHVRDQAFRRDHGNFETVISSALEMPRETVRRNLKQLIKMGYIVKKERSAYVLKPGAIQAPEYQAAIADAMRETLIFMNEAIDQGFIRWEPRQERR